MRLSRLATLTVLTGVLAASALPGVAAAAGPPVGFYGQWSAADLSVRVPSPTFPVGTLSAPSGSPTVVSGASTFLNAATPFGAEFRSSRNQPYVSLRTPGSSTATVTFATATPAGGWGFALGDVDAETVVVSATGPGGALTAAQLGAQGTFSGCTGTPRPGECPGLVPGDQPVLDTTGTPDAVAVVGQVPNSIGASAWFLPTVPVTTLTLSSTRTSDPLTNPVFQLWIAAQEPSVALAGTVTSTDPAVPPAGATVLLERPDGSPVVDPATTEQAAATAAADGSFTFPELAPEPVVAVLTTPAGRTAVPVDLSAGDVAGLTVALPAAPVAPPVTAPVPVGPDPVAPGPVVAPPLPVVVAGPQLADTGSPVGVLAVTAGLLLAVGAGTVLVSRRTTGS